MGFIPKPDEFYIGYLPNAPEKTAKFIVGVVAAVIAGVLAVCIILVMNQKKFSNGIFEYGQLTTVEGVLSVDPFPNIRVDEEGKSKFILIVGFGKSGAGPVIKELEKRTGMSLNNQFIGIKGTRIYDHGKELLQIASEDNLNLEAKPLPENFPPAFKKGLGQYALRGEVVDPKCYFGVMKPGEGKPHRSCAIRCIAGGIPPVFSIKDSNNDFLILTGDRINEEIIPLVGDPVELKGEIFEIDGWKIMNVQMHDLKLQGKKRTMQNLISLEEDITVCITEK